MAILGFTGLETGDASEIVSLGSGASITNTSPIHGGYSLKAAAAGCELLPSLSATNFSFRSYFKPSGSFAASPVLYDCYDSGFAGGLSFYIDSTGVIACVGSGTFVRASVLGSTVLVAGNTYLFECSVAFNSSGGEIKIWINGNLEINSTHTGAITIAHWYGYGLANPNEWLHDDFLWRDALGKPGAGQCIARQGTTGTPTYNAWTKNGAATAALCWSDTPFSTATNCSDTVLNDAQTMLVALFSATQTGHGTQTIGAVDIINSCKVGMVAKTAIAGNGTIRRRVGGANVDTTVSLTTSDKYFQTALFTDTPANLNAYEIGAVSSLATLTTVEDLWLMVDYTPVVMSPFLLNNVV